MIQPTDENVLNLYHQLRMEDPVYRIHLLVEMRNANIGGTLKERKDFMEDMIRRGTFKLTLSDGHLGDPLQLGTTLFTPWEERTVVLLRGETRQRFCRDARTQDVVAILQPDSDGIGIEWFVVGAPLGWERGKISHGPDVWEEAQIAAEQALRLRAKVHTCDVGTSPTCEGLPLMSAAL